MESTSSSLLLRLGRPGDPAAWQRFIDLYTPLLYHWSCRMGLPSQDAADLVQDVFVTLIQKLPRFTYDPGKSFRAWLRAVAENRWRDGLRNRAAVFLKAGDAALADAAAPDGAASIWEAEYRQHLVKRAVHLMRSHFEDRTWKACWALVVDGKSGADTAAELGMTLDAVYAAKARVLHRLRVDLDGLLD